MPTDKIEVDIHLTPKQREAWVLLNNAKKLSLCYGGAKGGGKSFLFCLWTYMWCKQLIRLFKITKPLKNPLLVGFIGRQRAIDFDKTTLETFRRIIPQEAYRIKLQAKEIVIDEKVKVWYGGLDDRDTINKFNSAELAFNAIDQAEETEQTDLGTLEASLRLTHNGVTPPYKSLYTANPAECHIKYRFAKPDERKSNEYFVPALHSDNPYLPEGYEQTLESAFAYDPKLLRAYKDGDWDVLLPTNQLITQKMIADLKLGVFTKPVTKKLIACDPSIGGDACCIKVFYNTKVVESMSIHERDTMKIAGKLYILGKKHTCMDFAIDGIGIGKGVVDRLIEMGGRVIDIQSAENADDKDHFANRRAEMWAYVAEQMQDKQLEAVDGDDGKEVSRQLVAVKYKLVSGRLQLVPKKETRKVLGRSPDDADTYVYGVWGLSRISENVQGEVVQADRQGSGERLIDTVESENYINIC